MDSTTKAQEEFCVKKMSHRALVTLGNINYLWGEKPVLEANINAMTDNLIIRMSQMAWGEEIETVECKWPANWIEAAKDRWLPLWAKKRWPIRMEQRTLIATAVYPKMKLRIRRPDQDGAFLHLESTRGDVGQDQIPD